MRRGPRRGWQGRGAGAHRCCLRRFRHRRQPRSGPGARRRGRARRGGVRSLRASGAWEDSMSLNAMASPAAREAGPLVIFVRCRTGLARPRQQDRRGEPAPLAALGVDALVVDPRRGRLHRARRREHLPRLVVAVAHHQAVAVLVTLTGEPGRCRHPPLPARPRPVSAARLHARSHQSVTSRTSRPRDGHRQRWDHGLR